MNVLLIRQALALEDLIAAEAAACAACVAKLWCESSSPVWVEQLHAARQHAQRWRLMNDLMEMLIPSGAPPVPPIVKRAAMVAALAEIDIDEGTGPR